MYILRLPNELIFAILLDVVESSIHDGPVYTYGLTQVPLTLRKSSVQRYVKGFVRPEMLRWDAASIIRQVCWKWHDWAIDYALKSISISLYKGGEVVVFQTRANTCVSNHCPAMG
jgi:hypothetical protein